MAVKRRCVQCGGEFEISDDELKYYKSRGYVPPKRCKRCRKENRDEVKFFDDEMLHALVEDTLEKRRAHAQSVKHKHYDRPLGHAVENLFIIGNGFDIWQGLDTRYSDFFGFYEDNKIEISWQLGIEPGELTEKKSGKVEYLTQFDLLYFVLSGDYLPEREVNADFWSDFENSLIGLDAERINAYFGKEIDDLKDVRLDCDYAYEVIKKCFAEWLKGIEICKGGEMCRYAFKDSFFINFNYTDTLTKRFCVQENDIVHIHGKASDPDSIVFGHGETVTPDMASAQFGRRLTGLYIVETVLQKFFKAPAKQWRLLTERLKNKATDLGGVKNCYVLGHSLGKADEYYFKKLKKLLPQDATWHVSYFSGGDLKRAKRMVRNLNITNFQLYPSIDSALKPFGIKAE